MAKIYMIIYYYNKSSTFGVRVVHYSRVATYILIDFSGAFPFGFILYSSTKLQPEVDLI